MTNRKIVWHVWGVLTFSFLLAFIITHKPHKPATQQVLTENKTVESRTYVVKRGDWLSKIASRNGVDWHILAVTNGLKKPYVLNVGQVLLLPGTGSEEILRYILILKNLKTSEAEQLASHYALLCNKYNLDSKVFVSIAFQENAFRRTGITNNDIGHFQINYVHQVVNRNLSYTIQELNDDWKLNAELGAKYLKECIPKSKIEPRWSCYNSLTPGTEQEPGPQRIYAAAVGRHLEKLK